jgi:tripartite-type tricarboxylate transporter receptor subunit TctC
MRDLLGGQVPSGFVALLGATPNVKSGRLRALAVTSPRRSVALPDVPTMAESGLPGFDIGIWMALWAPAKTPNEIVAKLNHEVVKIVQSADFKRRMVDYGCEAASSTPEQLRRMQTAEIEKYKKIATEAGVEAE